MGWGPRFWVQDPLSACNLPIQKKNLEMLCPLLCIPFFWGLPCYLSSYNCQCVEVIVLYLDHLCSGEKWSCPMEIIAECSNLVGGLGSTMIEDIVWWWSSYLLCYKYLIFHPKGPLLHSWIYKEFCINDPVQLLGNQLVWLSLVAPRVCAGSPSS